MPDLLISDLDEATFIRLEAKAKLLGRTVPEVAKAILAAPGDATTFWERANRMRERLAAGGRVFPDSVPDIREDRER